MIKFIRGEQAKYFANDAYLSTYADSLYFATDTGVLFVNGQDYGSRYPFKDVEVVMVKDDDQITAEMPTKGLYLNLQYRDENLGSKVVFVAPFASAAGAGLMSAEYATALDSLIEIMDADGFGKVDGVADGDGILSLGDDKLLTATVGIDYISDESGKWLVLLGKDGVELDRVDAKPFVADGMLDDVKVVTVEDVKYVEFTWNVVDPSTGELKVDRVPLSELATEYKEGEGVSIIDGTIAVKLNESKTNMLKVSDDGLMLDKVNTDATVLQEDIVVAGLSGTLGTGSYTNGTTIPAGTSIYTILQNILCKEEYPSAKVSQNASLASKYSKPSFQLDNSGKTVEVGTTVNVSAVTGYDPTPTTKSRTYSGFTNGYSLAYGDDQETVTGNPASVSVTNVELESGTYSLKREYSGFGKEGAAKTTVSSSSNASSECSIDTEALVVASGTNTVTFTMSGPGHKGSIASSPDYYIVSNLGNTKSDKKVPAVSASTPSVATADSSSNSLSVTGAYKYYVGYAATKPATTADIKKLTTFSGWLPTEGHGDNTSVIGTLPAGNVMCIAMPSTYQLESITNTLGSESKGSFDTTASPAYKLDYELADKSTVEYIVYNMASGADWEYKKIKISKK